MTVIIGHICPSCAGALSIDLEKQMYICPYCGISFDYEYFREDNVLKIGSQALKNNEFNSASKAYDYALDKDPHNFEAIKGSLCSDLKWKSFAQVKEIRKLSKLSVIQKDFSHYKDAASDKDKFFFDELRECVALAEEYDGYLTKTENNEDAISKTKCRISDLNARLKIRSNYFYFLLTQFAGVICFFIIMIRGIIKSDSVIPFWICLGLLAVAFIIDFTKGLSRRNVDKNELFSKKSTCETLENENKELGSKADAVLREFTEKTDKLIDYKAE